MYIVTEILHKTNATTLSTEKHTNKQHNNRYNMLTTK